MFFKSLLKILEKGVAQPPENWNFCLPTDIHRTLWEGCLRHVRDGAGEKLRKRDRTAPKMAIWCFSIYKLRFEINSGIIDLPGGNARASASARGAI
jgi:hypothetical protein